ncbi:MAG: TIGR01777 family oxidoreductase [Salibacteraceae bacterium]
MRKALVTGGNGLVGSKLIELLLERGVEVHNLSRSGKAPKGAKGFKWDYKSNQFDSGAISGVDVIFHMAGAGVADKRWSAKQKKEILDSRVKTAGLLFNQLFKKEHSVKHIISASGVAFYGFHQQNEPYSEEAPKGEGFLADVSNEWEKSIKIFSKLDIETTSLRIGMVLSPTGGALEKLVLPTKFGVGSPLGSGQQAMPWIHLTDLANLFLFVADNKISGIYNAVASQSVTNKEFTKNLAQKLSRPMILPNVPGFLLKLMLGEMANEIALMGCSISNEKIKKKGFKFQFDNLKSAFEDLF